jgi:DNA invertase Pin-like site-specific DNA recombinase
MGRLTLNVLLSFAQFEREVTSERIRDKIAASKRKGLWVGGIAPLGYATKNRKIVVVEEEAEWVRIIFRRYLQLGSLNLLMADLRARGVVTKVRSLKSGRTVGGIPFTRGPLAHLLRNRAINPKPDSSDLGQQAAYAPPSATNSSDTSPL